MTRNQKIIKRYAEDGLSLQLIGDEFHISKQRVQQILDANRVPRRQRASLSGKDFEVLVEIKTICRVLVTATTMSNARQLAKVRASSEGTAGPVREVSRRVVSCEEIHDS